MKENIREGAIFKSNQAKDLGYSGIMKDKEKNLQTIFRRDRKLLCFYKIGHFTLWNKKKKKDEMSECPRNSVMAALGIYRLQHSHGVSGGPFPVKHSLTLLLISNFFFSRSLRSRSVSETE